MVEYRLPGDHDRWILLNSGRCRSRKPHGVANMYVSCHHEYVPMDGVMAHVYSVPSPSASGSNGLHAPVAMATTPTPLATTSCEATLLRKYGSSYEVSLESRNSSSTSSSLCQKRRPKCQTDFASDDLFPWRNRSSHTIIP